MTTTDIERWRPNADLPVIVLRIDEAPERFLPEVPAAPVVRLPNPWTPHLLAGCAVAGVSTVGAFVAAVLGEARLDLSAYAVLAAWVGVLLLSYAQSRYDRVRTLVAEPLDRP